MELGVTEEKDFYFENGQHIVISSERIAVKKRIRLGGAIAFVVGSIIGSGIFISPKGALENSGSIGMSFVIWGLCGVLTVILALIYAELGVLLPKSGGNYTVIKHGIGAVPAFLVSWTVCFVVNSGSRTVLALVFADYVCAPMFPKCGAPNSIRKSIAAVQILLLAITNTVSVNLVASLQGFFTVLKVSTLIVISVGGFVFLLQGKTENFDDAFNGTTDDITSITLAIYSCMWAYGGYNRLNDISEEILEPKKNIPRAIIISMVLVIMIYLSTNVSYVVMLSKDEFLSVPAVAFTWGERVLRGGAIFIPISVMCSVYGAANGGFFTDVRVRFAAARANHLPELLSFLHYRSRIPVASVVLNTVISLIFLVPGDITELINLTSFVDFLVQLLTVGAFLRIRYQRRNDRRKEEFQIPLVIAFLGIVICLFMLIAPFVSNPRIEFFYGVAFILAGLVFYLPFVHLGWRIPGFDYITLAAQLLMNVCPTVKEEDIQL